MIEFRGEKLSINQWAKRLGISRQCLSERLKAGWSLERALTSKKGASWKKKYIVQRGDRFGRLEVLREYSIMRNGVSKRMVAAQCDCGEVIERLLLDLVYGRVRSCGCLRRRENTNGRRSSK